MFCLNTVSTKLYKYQSYSNICIQIHVNMCTYIHTLRYVRAHAHTQKVVTCSQLYMNKFTTWRRYSACFLYSILQPLNLFYDHADMSWDEFGKIKPRIIRHLLLGNLVLTYLYVSNSKRLQRNNRVAMKIKH